MPTALRTRSCTERSPRAALRQDAGQSTVEAALLLPSVLLCLALLVQPACLLYTRGVMQAAAAETCRVAATRPVLAGSADASYRAYALRRLSAVPDVGVFHSGGDDGWEVEISGSSAQGWVRVRIETSVEPLPFLGVLAYAGGLVEDGAIRLSVEVETATRPSWVEGDYREWLQLWE